MHAAAPKQRSWSRASTNAGGPISFNFILTHHHPQANPEDTTRDLVKQAIKATKVKAAKEGLQDVLTALDDAEKSGAQVGGRGRGGYC